MQSGTLQTLLLSTGVPGVDTSSPHEECEGFRKDMPAVVAADGRRVVAPALRPAPGAAGSAGAGVKAATGPEAPLEGQERRETAAALRREAACRSLPIRRGLGIGQVRCTGSCLCTE